MCIEPEVENGYVTPIKVTGNMMVVNVTCNENFQRTGRSPLVKCYMGQWSSKIPVCLSKLLLFNKMRKMGSPVIKMLICDLVFKYNFGVHK